jgi:hypothetical protein
MRMVLANPGELARIVEGSGGLAALQAMVGGLIELWAVDGPAGFLGNDEARLLGLPFNRRVTLSDGRVWHIHGPFSSRQNWSVLYKTWWIGSSK